MFIKTLPNHTVCVKALNTDHADKRRTREEQTIGCKRVDTDRMHLNPTLTSKLVMVSTSSVQCST